MEKKKIKTYRLKMAGKSDFNLEISDQENGKSTMILKDAKGNVLNIKKDLPQQIVDMTLMLFGIDEDTREESQKRFFGTLHTKKENEKEYQASSIESDDLLHLYI